MKQEYIDAVNAGNVGKVRIALSNELLLDPRGKTFGEMLTFAKDKLPDLFEENKEADYDAIPKEKWDEDYLFKVKNDLDSNFSIEKLALYQAVIESVGKDKAERIEAEEQRRANTRRSAQDARATQKKTVVKPIPVTVTTGGAILTIVGICVGKALLTILGGAVMVGGVLLFLNDNRK